MSNKETLKFRVHTAKLLNEVVDNAMPKSMGVLKIPLNVFRSLLIEVGERAAELNDPELNALMCDLAIYGVADPDDPEYNPEILKEVYQKANQSKAKKYVKMGRQ